MVQSWFASLTSPRLHSQISRARLILLTLAIASSAPLCAGEITVFAAASLKNVLDDVADAFEAASEHEVRSSHAGSSALARQIEQGAPADVFISANVAWMDRLAEDALIDVRSRRDLVENRLVLVAPLEDSTEQIESLADLPARLNDGRIAMAMVDAVPAGIYGRAALATLGVWEDVEDRVVQTDNVRAALRLVAMGEAALGVVYATDAQADSAVRVVGRFDREVHPRIVYPVAVVAGRGNPAAVDFMRFLFAPTARAIFARHGFLSVERE